MNACEKDLLGNYFTLDLFVLELGRCDMVLGVQWLQSLVIVSWNFNKLSMDFSMHGQLVTLQGLVPTQLLDESSCKKINNLEMRGEILQMVNEGDCTCEKVYAEPIKVVLDQYCDVF